MVEGGGGGAKGAERDVRPFAEPGAEIENPPHQGLRITRVETSLHHN